MLPSSKALHDIQFIRHSSVYLNCTVYQSYVTLQYLTKCSFFSEFQNPGSNLGGVIELIPFQRIIQEGLIRKYILHVISGYITCMLQEIHTIR